MSSTHKKLPVWQAAIFYAGLFTLLNTIASLIEWPIRWAMTLPIIESIPLLRAALSLATIWVCAFIAITFMQKRFTFEANKAFKLWGALTYLVLSVILIVINLLFIRPIFARSVDFANVASVVAAVIIFIGTPLLFWWMTGLVLRRQPMWAVSWVHAAALFCKKLFRERIAF